MTENSGTSLLTKDFATFWVWNLLGWFFLYSASLCFVILTNNHVPQQHSTANASHGMTSSMVSLVTEQQNIQTLLCIWMRSLKENEKDHQLQINLLDGLTQVLTALYTRLVPWQYPFGDGSRLCLLFQPMCLKPKLYLSCMTWYRTTNTRAPINNFFFWFSIYHVKIK